MTPLLKGHPVSLAVLDYGLFRVNSNGRVIGICGYLVRTSADAIPQQSRAATGVRLQRLDKGDRLADVVLVPPEAETDDDNEASAEESSEPSAEG